MQDDKLIRRKKQNNNYSTEIRSRKDFLQISELSGLERQCIETEKK